MCCQQTNIGRDLFCQIPVVGQIPRDTGMGKKKSVCVTLEFVEGRQTLSK